MRPITIVKFIGSWFCIIAAVTLILIGHSLPIMSEVLAMLAIAFALAPASW